MTMFPMVEVEVEGSRARTKVRALLDTGFTDFLCLPTEIAVQLGLELRGWNFIEYADGTEKRELYFTGKVAFEGRKRKVEIYLTDSDEPLVGMKLLRGCQVLIDVPKKKVEITRTPKKKKTDEPKGE